MVDSTFLAVLRRHLRYLAPAEDLAAEAPLRDLGLDSMATIGLVIDLEHEFGITFQESGLQAETFASAATLWAEVGRSMRS